MHQLTITFGPAATIWWTLFKEKENAEKAFAELQLAKIKQQEPITGAPFVTITDDFGQSACIVIADIRGVLLEDLELSKVAQIERGLHQARTQARGEQMAQNDPVLKAAAMGRGNNMAMLSPMPGGRMHG